MHKLQIKTKQGWWTLFISPNLDTIKSVVKVNKLHNYRILRKAEPKKCLVPEESPPLPKKPWGVGKVARYLRISERSTRRFAEEKKIPAVKTSKGWMFNPKEMKKLKGKIKRTKGKIQFMERVPGEKISVPPQVKAKKPRPSVRARKKPKPRSRKLKLGKLWNVTQVAGYLRISVRSTRRFAEEKKIPATKTSKGWIFNPERIKKLKAKVKRTGRKILFVKGKTGR